MSSQPLDVAPTADLIHCKVPHIVKKNNLWLSDNGPIIPFMQKRSTHKRGCESQIQLPACPRAAVI